MIDLENAQLIMADFFKEKSPLKNLIAEKDSIKIKKIISGKGGYNIYILQLEGVFEDSPKFVVIEDPSKFFIVIGDEKRKKWDYFIGLILRTFPIDIGFSFLTSYEIREILKFCEDQNSKAIYYKRFVAKGVFGKNIDFTDVYYEKLKKKHYNGAFLKAKNKKGWIRMIEVYDEGNSFSFIINLRGQITLTKGNLSFLLSNLLKKEIGILSNKNKFYEKRDRINTQNKPKKIIIRFGGEVFDDKKKILQFLEKIEKYPSCNYNVVEGGNPFLYVDILDRKDMSAFSIRTYKDSSLLLIPKIKTTPYALQRFSKYLVENFMEGIVNEF